MQMPGVLQRLLGAEGAGGMGRLLAASSAGAFALRLVNAALVFATAALLGRLLGADGFGLYSYGTAWAVLLALPLGQGMAQLLVRYVATYRAQQAWPLLRGVLRQADLLAGVVTVALAAVAIAAVWALVPASDPLKRGILTLAFAQVPLLALLLVRQGALRGLERVVRGQLPEHLVRPGLLAVLAVGAWLILGPAFSALWAMGAQVTATALALVTAVVLRRRHLPPAVRGTSPAHAGREWLRHAGALALVGGIDTVNSQVDVLMLGTLATAPDVGIYTAAARCAGVVTFFLAAANLAISPLVSRLHAEGDPARLQSVATLTARGTALVATPAALALAAAGPWVLGLFGPEFPAGAPALAVLVAGLLFTVWMGPCVPLLLMTGHSGTVMRLHAAGLGANLLLNALLIPRWGVMGAAVAWSLALAGTKLGTVWSASRRTGIHCTAFVRRGPVRSDPA